MPVPVPDYSLLSLCWYGVIRHQIDRRRANECSDVSRREQRGFEGQRSMSRHRTCKIITKVGAPLLRVQRSSSERLVITHH